MFLSGFGSREAFGDAFLSTRRLLLFWMVAGPEAEVLAALCTGTDAAVIRGRVSVRRSRGLWLGHFAIVMLGTPTRGTSLTVIWNNRYSIWKALRFQLANGPVVFTE